MSSHLFEKLEEKIDDLLDQLKHQRHQLLDFQEENAMLEKEIVSLRSRQAHWEKSVASLLRKLEDEEPGLEQNPNTKALMPYESYDSEGSEETEELEDTHEHYEEETLVT